MKEPQYRLSQFKKAREKEKIIQQWIKGKKLSRLMSKSPFKLSRAQWWSLKKRYQREGFAALLDHRHGGKRRKVTGEVTEFIKTQKESRPEITSRELNELLKHRFGQVLSRVWLTQIMKGLGQKFYRGRPRKEKIDYHKGIPVDRAGIYFLKGADSDMEGVKTITEIILKGRNEYLDKTKRIPSWKVLHSSPQTVRKKAETLLYLPMFGMEKPYHLLKYHKRGLGILTGSGTRYSYNTLDKFLCEIDKLPIAKVMSEALAQCYIETLCIEIELEDGSYFYIDGHAKHVWSSKNIPKVFFTTLKRAERGLYQFFLNSSKGHPLILLTCPGDRHLTQEMFNLIDCFENAIGKEMVKVSIFDREGLSMAIFEEFARRKKYFISLLRENQYRGIEDFEIIKDFKPLKIEGKNGKKIVTEWVADARIKLKDKEAKKSLTVRVALIKKMVKDKEKLITIITNLTEKEEPDIARIARRYFDRWPRQENIFKDMMEAIKSDSNHGYKKEVVENRVILRKKEELETNLRGITRKIAPATKEAEKTRKQLKLMKELYQNQKETLRQEKRELHVKITFTKRPGKRKELLDLLKLKEDKLLKLSEKYAEQLSQLETTLKNKEQHLKSLISQRDNKDRELKALNLKEVLFDMKTEKDHIMSNFKILLTNLSRYAQEQYFPQQKEYQQATLETMIKTFYHQDGYVKIRKRKVDVTLHSYDVPELQKAVEYACMKFNAGNLRTLDSQRIWMWVEGAETPDVKF